MRKILIPTDFSDNSLNAIKYATELFKHGPTEIYLLNAFADEVYETKSSSSEMDFEVIKAKVKAHSEAELEKLKQQVLEFSPNPKHRLFTVSEFGMLVDSVNDWVERENMDVVVMGTKGHTGNKKITFGSNTLQVIKYVKCPVLAVPAVFGDVQPKNILFSTDFLLPYKRRELKLVSDLARFFAARINFLYVSKFSNLSLRQQDNRAFLEASMQGNQVNFVLEKGTDITESINLFITKNKIDFLVMVNTRHSYLENILYQSTIEKIGLHIDIPFLVLQNLPR